MTLSSTPGDVIERIRQVCKKSFDMAIERMNKESERYSSMVGCKARDLNFKSSILTYGELCVILESKNLSIDKLNIEYKSKDLDSRDRTALIICNMLKSVPELRPAAVIALAPPFYPPRASGTDFKHIHKVCSRVVERSRSIHGLELIPRDYFPGLCDLSYLGLSGPEIYHGLKSNMPLYGDDYRLPEKALSNINIGGINIGVMGKDAHKYTERLNLPYSLKVTPDLVLYAIRELLS